MNLLDVVREVRSHLAENGRVSLRMLRRQFELDDDALDELVEELVDVQQVAVREGRVLAWVGPARPEPPITEPSRVKRAPRDYTPKHLAEKILQSKSALEGERKQVTVLFADVKGSMELAEELDPEVWHELLDRFFEILAEGVHRFEGTVNQYTGDGIMALFGAPIAHEDHAQRACYAALDLRAKLSRYARQVKREHDVSFSTRMGINSGEVIVGRIGDDLRMDYTAQGHAVGLAQRMETLASPDTCYLTGVTAALVAGYFELEDLGEFRVKGVEDAVPVHELRGIGAARTRFDVSRRRGLSRFVGRQADMQTLDAALEHAIEGHGQVVGLVAEAGAGKSRLSFEFLERCTARGIPVARGHSVAHGKNVPYLPITEIFRDYYGIQAGDAPRAVREKIAGRLLLLDASLEDALPLMFELFGVGDPAHPAAETNSDARQRQMFGVLRRAVQGEGEPRVWLIEDLHWMDGASEAFVAQWIDTVPGTTSVLLLNFRPEYSADWMTKSWYQQLPLAPLGPEAIRGMLGDLLGSDPSVTELSKRIHQRTKGNPFFAEEIAQSLIESGALEGGRGAYRLVEAVDELEIPVRVTSLLAARIDRLAEREKHVLQTAAVLGKEFSGPLLETVSGVSSEDLATAIERLQGGEFLYPQALYPVAEYTFKHPLTQEVALGSLLGGRLRELHAKAARALEQLHADRLDENAALLAHHWEEAGDTSLAIRWHARAADLAVRRLAAPVESVRHWQRVRALGASLRDDPDVAPTLLTACRSVLMLGAWRLGLSRDEVDAVANEGRALAERLGARDQLSTLVVAQATAQASFGDTAGCYKLAREGAGLLEEDAPLENRVVAQTQLVYSAWLAGHLAEAIDALEELRILAASDPYLGLAGIGYSALGSCDFFSAFLHSMAGDIGAARRSVKDGLPRILDLGSRETAGYLLGAAATVAKFYGGSVPGLLDPVAAALEAIETFEASGNRFGEIAARSSLATAHLACGHPADAAEAASETLRMMRDWNVNRVMESDLLATRAQALLACGDLAEAQRLAREAIELDQRGPTPVQEIESQLALADALLATRGADVESEVSSAIERGLELTRQTGACSNEPLLYEARARLASALGDADAAEANRRAALTLFREIGAEAHAERLAAELE